MSASTLIAALEDHSFSDLLEAACLQSMRMSRQRKVTEQEFQALLTAHIRLSVALRIAEVQLYGH